MKTPLKNLTMQIKSSQEILDNARNSVKQVLEEVVKDESIPLFDRWCLFMEYCSQCLPVSSSIINRKITDGVRGQYDLERYQTIYFPDTFEESWITEDEKSNPPEAHFVTGIEENFMDLDQELVKSVLNCGYSGFEYDW